MKVNEFRLKLYPKDYDSNYKFFKDVLNFPIKYEWDRENGRGVMFDIGGTTLEFMWPVEENYKDMSTGSGLSLAVDDAQALFEKPKEIVTITYSVRKQPWGDISFGIATPSGYRISFFTKTKDYED